MYLRDLRPRLQTQQQTKMSLSHPSAELAALDRFSLVGPGAASFGALSVLAPSQELLHRQHRQLHALCFRKDLAQFSLFEQSQMILDEAWKLKQSQEQRRRQVL